MLGGRHLATLLAIVALLLAPAGVLAADPSAGDPTDPGATVAEPVVPAVIDVTGTVHLPDGSAVADATVLLQRHGDDAIQSTKTDADGAFAFSVEVFEGDVLDLSAFSPLIPAGTPTDEGCQAFTAATGRLTVDTLPPDPVDIVLDGTADSAVCSATARPEVTPPATDVAASTSGPSTGGAVGLLAVLALVTFVVLTGSLRLAPRRR